MNVKKYMLLMVGGGICLVLAIVETVLLFRFHATYRQVNDDLASSMSRLTSLYQRDPYPSEENVKRMDEQVNILEAFFDRLYMEVRSGQIEPVSMEPAQFPQLLGDVIRPLYSRAADNGVKLPPRFAFGFNRYALGELPISEDIPRLVVQLKTMDLLLGLLYQAKVSEIQSVKRTLFEKGGTTAAPDPSAGSRRRRGGFDQPAPEAMTAEQEDAGPYADLFSKDHFTLTFMASDAAIWDILNSMATTKVFIVVTRLELNNAGKEIKRGTDIAARPILGMPDTPGSAQSKMGVAAPSVVEGPGTVETVPSREERIAAGREQVLAILDVDVYRFTAVKEEETQP